MPPRTSAAVLVAYSAIGLFLWAVTYGRFIVSFAPLTGPTQCLRLAGCTVVAGVPGIICLLLLLAVLWIAVRDLVQGRIGLEFIPLGALTLLLLVIIAPLHWVRASKLSDRDGLLVVPACMRGTGVDPFGTCTGVTALETADNVSLLFAFDVGMVLLGFIAMKIVATLEPYER